MELLAKTEDLPSDIVDNLELAVVTLNLGGREIDLQHAYQGHDFVFGLSQGCLVAVPVRRITLMRTAALPGFDTMLATAKPLRFQGRGSKAEDAIARLAKKASEYLEE